jgi:hypothetical protein
MMSPWIGSITYCSQASSLVLVCRPPGENFTEARSMVAASATELLQAKQKRIHGKVET